MVEVLLYAHTCICTPLFYLKYFLSSYVTLEALENILIQPTWKRPLLTFSHFWKLWKVPKDLIPGLLAAVKNCFHSIVKGLLGCILHKELLSLSMAYSSFCHFESYVIRHSFSKMKHDLLSVCSNSNSCFPVIKGVKSHTSSIQCK